MRGCPSAACVPRVLCAVHCVGRWSRGASSSRRVADGVLSSACFKRCGCASPLCFQQRPLSALVARSRHACVSARCLEIPLLAGRSLSSLLGCCKRPLAKDCVSPRSGKKRCAQSDILHSLVGAILRTGSVFALCSAPPFSLCFILRAFHTSACIVSNLPFSGSRRQPLSVLHCRSLPTTQGSDFTWCAHPRPSPLSQGLHPFGCAHSALQCLSHCRVRPNLPRSPRSFSRVGRTSFRRAATAACAVSVIFWSIVAFGLAVARLCPVPGPRLSFSHG